MSHNECYAGSGTSLFGKALETSQGTQAKQKTAGRRRLGNGLGNNSQLILSEAAVREQVQGYNTIRSVCVRLDSGQICAQCGFSKRYITIVLTSLTLKEPNRVLEFAGIRQPIGVEVTSQTSIQSQCARLKLAVKPGCGK